MGAIWWRVCGTYGSLVRAGTGMGARAQPGSAYLSSFSLRLYRDIICFWPLLLVGVVMTQNLSGRKAGSYLARSLCSRSFKL